ncbi:MAG TPA: hypothetical protein VHX39_09625, partial [Acetobacteraceae bacterium]|nr:hypothetical protein [Acetobacteraceae bacterium]
MTRRPLTEAAAGKARPNGRSSKPAAGQDRSATLEPAPASRTAVKQRPVRSPAKDRPAQEAAVKRAPATAEPPPAKQPARPAMTRPIMVELNADVEGWPTRSRFDVVLLGQISSVAPVDTFTIHDTSGLELASVQFGQNDYQETETLIGGGIVYQTGFQVFLPMPGGDGVRVADMWVRARSRDGAAFEEGMRLGCMAGQAAILAGPVRGADEAEIPAPHGIVYLESADITAEGRLQVYGWTMATSAIVAVQILVDGRRVGTAVQGRERADVAAAYPSFPNARHAGFVFERAADAAIRGAANVRVEVVCLTGASHAATIPLSHADAAASDAAPAFAGSSPQDQREELPGLEASQRNFRAPPASDRDPSGLVAPHAEPAEGSVLLHCDHAAVTAEGGLMIQGWAISQAGIACVAVEVNGRPLGEANYGLERADLPTEQEGVPLPIGFDYVGKIPGFAGGTSYDVRVIATNRAGDRAEVTIAATSPNLSAFMFELDGPATRDGVMIQPVTGRLVIEGWAMARDGMAGIDVELDGTLLGHAHYGIARPDVGAVFPDWEGAARSGYTFHCPSRALPDGEHVIRLTARSKTGGSHVHAFRITVKKTDDPEEAASIRRRVKWVEQKTTNQLLDLLDWRPAFHVVVTGHPAGVTSAAGIDSAWGLTIGSILEQSWPRWRVTIVASGADDADAAQSAIHRLAHEQTERFAVITPSDTAVWQAPIAAGSEAALILLLAAGDELGRDAFSEFAVASGMHKAADCFYADEFRLPPSTTRPEAFFKPDFSPSLLLSSNYIGRPLVARPALLAAIAITPETLMRDGFHDLALRCTEVAAQTYHVTELLSRTDGGSAVNPENGVAALRNAMVRRVIGAEVLPGMLPETFRVRQTAVVTGKVSIIVPTCAAQGFVDTCFSTLRAQTEYRNFEIVCIDNIPETEAGYKQFVREHADRIVE